MTPVFQLSLIHGCPTIEVARFKRRTNDFGIQLPRLYIARP